MQQLKCPKCMTPQIDGSRECKVCGSAVSVSGHAPGNNVRAADVRATDVRATKADPSSDAGAILYPVSSKKFLIMNLTTFGLYSAWWSYKNWTELKHSYGRKVSTLVRGLFEVIFSFSLAKQIKLVGEEVGGPAARFDPTRIGVSFLILNALSKAPDPVGLLSIFAFLALNPLNNYLIELNTAKGRESEIDGKFTVLNYVFIVIGGLLLFAQLLMAAADSVKH